MSAVNPYLQNLKSAANSLQEYLPLVKRIAHHLLARLPNNVQLDDLIQAGLVGLFEASQRYDASKGASFETYAGIRIRGTMLDEVRRNNWAPRSVHKNTRMISEAICQLEHKLGREACDSEVAEALDITIDQYHQMLCQSSTARLFDIDDVFNYEEIMENAMTNTSIDPSDGVQYENFCRVLMEGMAGLPEREQLVLSLYYDEELNLKEIGEVLGVSESRVCQIHSQAMLRLQSRIGNWK